MTDKSFKDYLIAQWGWSRRTFGPGLRTATICAHARKELIEIERDPHDLTERVDLIMLAMDGYWRAGGTVETLLPDLLAKQRINFARTWPAVQPEGEPVEHVRELPLPDTCKPGKHMPAIVHRTGGLSANRKNTCGLCGRMIEYVERMWIIDVAREKSA